MNLDSKCRIEKQYAIFGPGVQCTARTRFSSDLYFGNGCSKYIPMLGRFERRIFRLNLCVDLSLGKLMCDLQIATLLTFRRDGGIATPGGTEKQSPSPK